MKLMTAAKDLDISNIGMDIADVLVHANFAKTKSEARRQVEQGAVKIEGITVTDKFARLIKKDLEFILLQKL